LLAVSWYECFLKKYWQSGTLPANEGTRKETGADPGTLNRAPVQHEAAFG
jgi:hypothetical protein